MHQSFTRRSCVVLPGAVFTSFTEAKLREEIAAVADENRRAFVERDNKLQALTRGLQDGVGTSYPVFVGSYCLRFVACHSEWFCRVMCSFSLVFLCLFVRESS